jgi:competence protein ComEA
MEQPVTPEDPFARLAPVQAHGHASRWRLGVGAAIVLLVMALAAAIVISAVGAQRNRSTVAAVSESSADVADAAGGAGGTGGTAPGTEGADSRQGALIFVHVLGAVALPGLYELSDGARVVDVIAAAGGLAPNADPAGVNLARQLSDGEQLYVPVQGEVSAEQLAAGGSGGGSGGASDGAGSAKVNLNSATTADLQSLPRIGEAMAQRIIDYREANGRFRSIEDLRNITGIGDKTFEALKDLVTI